MLLPLSNGRVHLHVAHHHSVMTGDDPNRLTQEAERSFANANDEQVFRLISSNV
jgi:hypothetical protein